jgi:2-polyprenyl-6-methoxyphenol hydroxylase-like FAD-dependent oxidoreductase
MARGVSEADTPRAVHDLRETRKTMIMQAWTDSGLHTTRHSHAIVIGGSLSGLLAARVLSEHVESVTIIERDHVSDAPQTRRGVPQGRHVHTLLGRGAHLLERWFPGLTDTLEQRPAGIISADTRRDSRAAGAIRS